MTRLPSLTEHSAGAAPAWLDTPVGPAGIAYGVEQPGLPVLLRLFRSRPTTVGLFGPAELAALLAMRAVGAGAQVCVRTPRPAPWAAVQSLAPGPGPWVTLVPPGSTPPVPGGGRLPWLLVDELAPGESATRHEPGPWQAAVTVYPSLTAQQAAALPAYDLLILHRVPAQAVEPLRAATGLSQRSAKWLPRMPDDVVALVAGGHARYAVVTLDPVEQTALTSPRQS